MGARREGSQRGADKPGLRAQRFLLLEDQQDLSRWRDTQCPKAQDREDTGLAWSEHEAQPRG